MDTFNYLKDIIKIDAFRNRAQKFKINYSPKLPPEIGLQLTYRCNLRCKSCMQWSVTGYLKNKNNKEYCDLELDVIRKILQETEKDKSSLYLWGGEPLIHCRWHEISSLLERDKRKVVLSTNGILINERIQSLLRIGSKLFIVISLDGEERQNNLIRGNATYEKIIQGIQTLNLCKKDKSFSGEIIINTVLNKYLIPSLSDYVSFVESINVDLLILSLPWYLSPDDRSIMDKYFIENFDWLKIDPKQKASWHYFQFFIPDDFLSKLREQLEILSKMKLKIKLRLKPKTDPEVGLFSSNFSYSRYLSKNTFCFGSFRRISICANGDVSACPDFPEFVVGNLFSESLTEVWNGSNYQKIRELRSKGLWPLPVCLKCSLFSANRI
jgi:radical SAM protein with 4Fe4S-binding SPASM domain